MEKVVLSLSLSLTAGVVTPDIKINTDWGGVYNVDFNNERI